MVGGEGGGCRVRGTANVSVTVRNPSEASSTERS